MRDQQQLESWNDLSGKVVMVTGASSGIGSEFCLDLAKAGCQIVASARRIDRLELLCNEINRLTIPSSKPQPSGYRHRAIAVELDVCGDGATIRSSVKRAWDAFGRIDCLINNAGIRGNVRGPLELSEEEWNETMRTNLTGAWLVSKYVCKHMRDSNQQGSIINISSISGLTRTQQRGALAYSCSKAALNAMTKIMAEELGVHKIRVNSISRGLFKSEITEALLKKDWLEKVLEKIIPLETFGTTDPALTSLVRYLIHDSSEYVSGNVFIVEAGDSLPGVPIFSSL